MKTTKQLVLVVLTLMFITWQACDKEVFFGRLVINITDDPFPIEIVEEASFRVFKFEAHPKDSEEDADMILLSDDTVTYNLIDLRNGATETLIDAEMKTGGYDYFRMYVDEATLKIIDGETYTVKVPSGSTSGIKVLVDPAIIVEEGLTSELLLDVDLSKSFVINGSYYTPAGIKGFNFKPVLRAINISDAGQVDGLVKDTESKPINAVEVTLELDTNSYSTFSDSTGFYNLIGIPTGIYSLTAEKEGYETLILQDVVVVAANKTTRNITLLK